ncbi:MAG: mycofactocin system FadH/OYE family oxidoreductase 2 [Actinobacteria bacterium]|nr:mycofactocin system FadH/OYE family oxidoreductase 2 [Actinomycetota bacterium]
MSRYRHLFTPLRLGPVVVRNRIVFSAHLTNFAEDGLPTERHAAYYAARAVGGAGLIVTEEHSTHPTDWPYEKLIHGFRPDVIPGYRAITQAVHRHDVPVFAQINHNGGQGSGMYSRLPAWAPSAVADPLFREVPKAIDAREIAEVVAGYALVAERCRTGGFDGIELQCSHSSLLRGFLSRATNLRTDRYGGSLENRATLLLEIVAAVREAIGPGLALGVRLCGDELIDDGITIDEAVETARLVEATGQIDYVNTSIGVATATLYMIEASMAVPPGYALFIPSAIREAVRLPVVGVGRFKDPLQADRALADGHCDLVGVVRGQIADADFAAKARAGLPDEIRLCLSCNQECVGRMGLNRRLACIESPRTGDEAIPLSAASTAKRVLVVGAGPAGMQAAITAARRGHRVRLVEAEEEPGGQIRVAATAPSRAELGDLVRNQMAELRRLGVEIETERWIDEDAVVAEPPDAVVVATGAQPSRPWWAPAEATEGQPAVVDVRDVLEGRAHPEGSVLVVDELGFHQATSVAEVLADRGCAVEIASPGMVVGQDLGITLDLETWWLRATRKGIVQTPETMVTGLIDGGVAVQDLLTGEPGERRVTWVVVAGQQAPADELYHALRARERAGAGPPVHRVGDCVAPRRAHAAVIEGDRIGALL